MRALKSELAEAEELLASLVQADPLGTSDYHSSSLEEEAAAHPKASPQVGRVKPPEKVAIAPDMSGSKAAVDPDHPDTPFPLNAEKDGEVQVRDIRGDKAASSCQRRRAYNDWWRQRSGHAPPLLLAKPPSIQETGDTKQVRTVRFVSRVNFF